MAHCHLLCLAQRAILVHQNSYEISAIGLMTIAIGTAAAIKTENGLIPLLALVLGSIIGEWIDSQSPHASRQGLVSVLHRNSL
jgi:uncharacterized membrane protein YqgA involved in biofilm formation